MSFLFLPPTEVRPMEKEISGSLEHKKKRNIKLWERCKNCPYSDGEENGCVLYGQSEDCLYALEDW